jgi:hypothetical protein
MLAGKDDDFKFSCLKRKQLLKIVDGYSLDIDRTLPRKKLIKEMEKKVSILEDGTVVHSEDKDKSKEEVEGSGKYNTHLIGIKIKYLN